MKQLATRALCALTLAGFASAAAATPIYFNFTGTITGATGTYANSGLESAVVFGGFTFDTENLTRFSSPDLATSDFYTTSSASYGAFVNYGSGSIDAPVYAPDQGASIFFADTDCYQLLICHPRYEFQEGFSISTVSRDVDFASSVLTPGYIGQVRESALNVSSWNYDFADFASFDWASAAPMDIVSRTLHDVSGYYAAGVYTCTGESFCPYEETGGFNFSVDSVTRGTGPVSVPEPGTFTLLGLGLAGIYLARRRAGLRSLAPATS